MGRFCARALQREGVHLSQLKPEFLGLQPRHEGLAGMLNFLLARPCGGGILRGGINM